jgi:hypothetical protein
MTDARGSAGTRDVFVLDCGAVVPEAVAEGAQAAGARESTSAVADTIPAQPQGSGGIVSLRRLGNIRGHIAHVVGIFHRQGAARRSKLVFLDDRSWVCSIDLYGLETEEAAFTSYTRHFFVPYDWFAGTRSPIGAVTSYGDVVFAKNGDVAVVQGGLDYAD